MITSAIIRILTSYTALQELGSQPGMSVSGGKQCRGSPSEGCPFGGQLCIRKSWHVSLQLLQSTGIPIMRFLPLMVALTSAPVGERHLASNGLAGHATKGCGELSSSALRPQGCTWAPGHLSTWASGSEHAAWPSEEAGR